MSQVAEELKKAFEEFKAANDTRLAEIEKKGGADPLLVEKTEKLNALVGSLQDQLKKADARIRDVETASARGGLSGNADPVKSEHRKAFAQFMRSGADAGLRDLEVKAALSVGSDPDGGYFVPDEASSEITRVMAKISSMRQLAQVVTISSASYKRLVNTGGATSGWVGERDARPETNTPKLNALDIPAHEIYANPSITQSALDDSAINLESWLADEVSIEFGEQEGAAFISGNGVFKPRGILGYTPAATYAWGNPQHIVSGAAATLGTSLDPLINTMAALKQGYRSNAAWVMNRTAVATLRKLKDTTNQYIWQPSNIIGQAGTLFGYPIVDDDNMPDEAANAFPVAFGDYKRAYLIVDRLGARVLRDPYTNKPYVMFYTTKRVGGAVQNFEAYKLIKCST